MILIAQMLFYPDLRKNEQKGNVLLRLNGNYYNYIRKI